MSVDLVPTRRDLPKDYNTFANATPCPPTQRFDHVTLCKSMESKDGNVTVPVRRIVRKPTDTNPGSFEICCLSMPSKEATDYVTTEMTKFTEAISLMKGFGDLVAKDVTALDTRLANPELHLVIDGASVESTRPLLVTILNLSELAENLLIQFGAAVKRIDTILSTAPECRDKTSVACLAKLMSTDVGDPTTAYKTGMARWRFLVDHLNSQLDFFLPQPASDTTKQTREEESHPTRSTTCTPRRFSKSLSITIERSSRLESKQFPKP